MGKRTENGAGTHSKRLEVLRPRLRSKRGRPPEKGGLQTAEANLDFYVVHGGVDFGSID